MLVGPLYHHENLDGSGYPAGLTKKDIPFYAQIIHVADVFDAIVSKRQYKTHINISETLKVILKDVEPSRKSLALDALNTESKYGKISEKALKALFKVVIDDTNYEISCTMEYVNYLKDQVKRLKSIEKYDEKADKAKRAKDRVYYREYMKLLFQPGESFENYRQVAVEYGEALQERKKVVDRLYKEIEIIKKLK